LIHKIHEIEAAFIDLEIQLNHKVEIIHQDQPLKSYLDTVLHIFKINDEILMKNNDLMAIFNRMNFLYDDLILCSKSLASKKILQTTISESLVSWESRYITLSELVYKTLGDIKYKSVLESYSKELLHVSYQRLCTFKKMVLNTISDIALIQSRVDFTDGQISTFIK
jgi:hypothetical protein